MSRSAHHNFKSKLNYRYLKSNALPLTDNQLEVLPVLYSHTVSTPAKIKAYKRFLEIAKKEHYNEPNYGKLFECR